MKAADLFPAAVNVQAARHPAQQLDAYYAAQMQAAKKGMQASGANYSAYRNHQADWAEAQQVRDQLRRSSMSPADLAAEERDRQGMHHTTPSHL
jgi:hypothetical protein